MNDNSDKKRFRKLREKAGLSQKEAALLLGVSIDAVHTWEQGVRGVPPWALPALERIGALGPERLQDLLALEREPIRPMTRRNVFNIFEDLIHPGDVLPPGRRVYHHLVELAKFDADRICAILQKYVSRERAMEILASLEAAPDGEGPEVIGPLAADLDAFLLWREIDRLIGYHADLARYERLRLFFLRKLPGQEEAIREFWRGIREARREFYRLLRRRLAAGEEETT